MKKRISIILAAVILLSTAVVAADIISPPEPKADNQVADWAMDAVIKAGEKNILEKERNYIFESPITREEFCELIYNLIEKTTDVKWKKVSPTPFDDTHNEKVIALLLENIIRGKADRVFAPNDLLTREEAAVIIERCADNVMHLPRHEVYYKLADSADISDWAESGVQTVCNMGVMKGTGDGKFLPKGTFTTEEAITAIMRMFDTYEANERNTEKVLSFADSMNEKMPDDKNYMFSPFSIKMALLMAANGADGETQEEILKAIDIEDLEEYNKSVKEMLDTYSQSELLKIDIANSIWINKDRTAQRFSESFEKKLADVLGATSNEVDSKNAADKINGWVNEKTNGKIPAIISKDDTNFWAMLVNAVYFKGRWQSGFDEAYTKKDTFTDRLGKKTDIDFMNKTSWIQYADECGVQIAALPYLTREDKFSESGEYIGSTNINLDISMYLMMSDNEFNPNEVLDKADMSRKFIDLCVPKFEIEYSTKLNNMLKDIGIEKAFGENADFKNMFDSGNMKITDALHKTYIKVDEEGTEAAAVTALAMAGSALPPEPIQVKFNKPFTFVIRDNKTSEILFMGEYAFAE